MLLHTHTHTTDALAEEQEADMCACRMRFNASWLLTSPARDVSLLNWNDFTHFSERGLAGGIPKAFNAAQVHEGELLPMWLSPEE